MTSWIIPDLTKYAYRIRIAVLILFCAVFFPTTCFGTNENAGVFVIGLSETEMPDIQYNAVRGDQSSFVAPQIVDGKNVIFLPASVDFTQLTIETGCDAKLIGAIGEIQMTPGTSVQDLSAVCGGGMVGGILYPLKVGCEAKGTYQFMDLYVIKSEHLPSIFITLDTDISEINSDKTRKASGSFIMKQRDGRIISCSLKHLKGRGNVSWTLSGEKKPYNIKLAEEMELIPRAGAAKDWCLLSNDKGYDNHSGLHNMLGHGLYQKMQGDSALQTQNVDLYINGEYRGSYFLTEKVEIHSERVDITEPVCENKGAKSVTRVIREGGIARTPGYFGNLPGEGDGVFITSADESDVAIAAGIQAYQYATNSFVIQPGGFLLEEDRLFFNEPAWFLTKMGTTFVLKQPEFASKGQVQKIAIYVQKLEDAIYSETGYNSDGAHYSELLDLDSFVKAFFVDAFLGNDDILSGSTFYHMDVQYDGNLVMPLKRGPGWDYDSLFNIRSSCMYADLIGMGEKGRGSLNNNRWIDALMKKGDFMERFTFVSSTTGKAAIEVFLDAEFDGFYDEVAASQKMNQLRWGNDFENAFLMVRAQLINRYSDWYDVICSNEKLLGCSIKKVDKALQAEVIGTAASYQWYQIDPATRLPIMLEDETKSTFSPRESGEYFVSVTGVNAALNPYALEHIEEYLYFGNPTIVAETFVTMNSEPVTWNTSSSYKTIISYFLSALRNYFIIMETLRIQSS